MNNLIMKFLVFIAFIACFNNVSCADNCNFGTCGECISYAHDNCIWCAQDKFTERRCQPYSALNSKAPWCKEGPIYNPKSTMNVTLDKGFSETIGVAVQFRPQIIKMKARPGVPMAFNMSYKPAKDFPLDVYYLMDTSFTMKKKLKDLEHQAKNIHKNLTSYTNNVRLGIGSFVEKPGFPFVHPVNHKSHAFKNLVSLTADMTQFTSKISSIQFGANFDDPEAGLDALMQAMMCEDEIGWRKGARRIIVLCTDSTYHSAGDGKMVGAIKPHDMQCHMENNSYTMALTLDYPSVSQINKVATDGNFRIIFAIAQHPKGSYDADPAYKMLVQRILGAKYAKLEDETSVIMIIRQAYEESARTVQIDYKFPDYIQLTVDQDCDSKPTKNCESTHTEQIVTIPATLTVNKCPTNRISKHEIKPFGLEDKLTIDLEVECKCDCEIEGGVKSAQCNNLGVFQCGVCKCDPGNYGVDCRCNGTSTDRKDEEKCILGKGSRPCSGKGICRCGKCEKCSKGFSGDFCEFDDSSCPRPNNQLCFGMGKCHRGRCECHAGWIGDDCSCSLDNKNCIAPYSKEVCSGNGQCICGACVCNHLKGNNDTYSGAYCDICEDCAEKRCRDLEGYVTCNYEHMDNKAFCDQQNNGTTTEIGVFFVNKTEINGPEWYMATWCKKEFENGTYIVFKYRYDDHDLNLVIQKESELPPKANPWIAAGWAIGLVLLIGLLTVIIWKVLVDLHDKREYNKFSDEAAAAGYDVSLNPLYQAPAMNFSNPVYNECT